MTAPEGLFLVTDTGMRVPIDLKFAFLKDGIAHFYPVIEADLNTLMPSVVAFDGPRVRADVAISFLEGGPGWDTAEWGQRVMANSRHVFAFYVNGDSE